MNLIIMGKPGAGKGTQTARLLKDKNFKVIATGDLIRQEIRNNSSLGQEVKSYSDKGLLVPDTIILKILKKHINKAKDVLFDGFPRTINQAKELENIAKPDLVLFLHVDDEIVIKRISNRQTVLHENKNFIFPNKEQAEKFIAKKGGVLIKRKDDTKEVIVKRLKEYQEHTKELVNFYKSKNIFYSLDGSKNVEEVHKELLDIINNFNS